MASTTDGGKTWTGRDKRLPFRSAVAWAKDRWVAVGTSGSHVSQDNGATWKLLDRENYNSVGFTATGPTVLTGSPRPGPSRGKGWPASGRSE